MQKQTYAVAVTTMTPEPDAVVCTYVYVLTAFSAQEARMAAYERVALSLAGRYAIPPYFQYAVQEVPDAE